MSRATTPRGLPNMRPSGPSYCSFCGKQPHEVAKIVIGPSVYICDECVKVAQQVVDDHLGCRQMVADDIGDSTP